MILGGSRKDHLVDGRVTDAPTEHKEVLTSNPADLRAEYCARICATAQPSSLVRTSFWAHATVRNKRMGEMTHIEFVGQ